MCERADVRVCVSHSHFDVLHTFDAGWMLCEREMLLDIDIVCVSERDIVCVCEREI